MINTSGLWALRVVSSCAVPGPGLAKAGEYGLGRAGQVEEIQLWAGESAQGISSKN